jgi:hypothetical protein
MELCSGCEEKTNFIILIKKHRNESKDIVSAYKDNVVVKGPKVTHQTKRQT